MTLFLECVAIVIGFGYFFAGLIFCLNFALDLGKKGFIHFKDFIGEQTMNVFLLFVFLPWLLIALVAYSGTWFLYWCKGESMN